MSLLLLAWLFSRLQERFRGGSTISMKGLVFQSNRFGMIYQHYQRKLANA